MWVKINFINYKIDVYIAGVKQKIWKKKKDVYWRNLIKNTDKLTKKENVTLKVQKMQKKKFHKWICCYIIQIMYLEI